ncbi:hypothetical protein COY52_00750, partial [Candidatus Desantisbacteria bacterium CG_4_10_14_0_8_um_filter_48_22]
MVIYGVGAATYYDLWSSSANSWVVTGGATPSYTGTRNWLRIAGDPKPDSNYIAYSSLDGKSDWNVTIWNGYSWAAIPAENPSLETNAARCIDVSWEKDSGVCMFVAGDRNSRELTYIGWSEAMGWYDPVSGSTTTPAYPFTTPAGTLSLSRDINWTGLISDPNENKMICYIIDQANDLTTINWSGTNWTGATNHELTVSDRTKECASIALDKHDIIVPAIIDVQGGDDNWRNSSGTAYNIQFQDEGGSYLNRFEIKSTTGTGIGSQVILDWSKV